MNTDNIFNVQDFGAKGDGTHDDTRTFMGAIAAADAANGGIVWVPPGKYKITGRLEITRQVIIQGAGWNPAVDTEGSWLFMTKDYSEQEPGIVITSASSGASGRGTMIKDLAFHHFQNNADPGWEPIDYPFAIEIHGGSGDDVFLENIMLRDATNGIKIQTGRVNLQRIFGNPLTVGIETDNAYDVVKINNVHFWSGFWSEGPVLDWMYNNATAIRSLKNDNPHFSNIFALGYHYGFHFGQSASGYTSKFHLVNVDLDYCYIGLFVDGDTTTGQLCNFTSQGADIGGRMADYGIKVESHASVIQGINLNIVRTRLNAVRVEETSHLYLDNTGITDWNLAKLGYPGYEVKNIGGSITLGAGRYDVKNDPADVVYGGAPGTISGANTTTLN
ncbi:MAG: hypothetical protein Roseis2KO_45400 [Roseivirga sp.]